VRLVTLNPTLTQCLRLTSDSQHRKMHSQITRKPYRLNHNRNRNRNHNININHSLNNTLQHSNPNTSSKRNNHSSMYANHLISSIICSRRSNTVPTRPEPSQQCTW
jgi:hypothetical protein